MLQNATFLVSALIFCYLLLIFIMVYPRCSSVNILNNIIGGIIITIIVAIIFIIIIGIPFGLIILTTYLN